MERDMSNIVVIKTTTLKIIFRYYITIRVPCL